MYSKFKILENVDISDKVVVDLDVGSVTYEENGDDPRFPSNLESQLTNRLHKIVKNNTYDAPVDKRDDKRVK